MKAKNFLLLGVAAAALLLVGCKALDNVLGVPTPEPGAPPGPAQPLPPLNPVSPLGILETLVPGAAALIAALRWGYSEIRARKLDASFKGVVAGVEDFVKGDGADRQEALYKTITEASEIYANRDFFAAAVERAKTELRSEEPEPPAVQP